MAKKKKFKGNNAKLVGDTRLTKREMRKFEAAYHNVQRDNEAALAARLASQAHTTDLSAPAELGTIE